MGKISSSNQELVTKGFLKSTLKAEFEKHTAIFGYKLNDLEERLDKKFDKYRDEVMTMLDKIMGELITIRQENAIFNAKFIKDEQILGQHEIRLDKLEKTTQIQSLN